MNKEGHLGLSFLLFSPLLIPFGINSKILIFIMFAIGFSSLPDLDQKFEIKHREYTHNIGFGLVSGTILGIPVGISGGILLGMLIFSSLLFGVLSHLLGDIIAGLNPDGSPWKLEPFKPFSSKSIGYGNYKATDKGVNRNFLKAGTTIFVLSILISQGVIRDIISSI